MAAKKSAYIMGLEGEVERDQQGKPKRRPDWAKDTTDPMGRAHNAKLHGPSPELDRHGYLVVKRREGGPKPLIKGSILDNTLALHKSEGYMYYFANAKNGRIETMAAHDWEVVQGSDGPVQLKLAHQRELGAEHTVLMRKPLEWYEEDQREKHRQLTHDLTVKAQPIGGNKDRDGQGYGTGLREDNPLR